MPSIILWLALSQAQVLKLRRVDKDSYDRFVLRSSFPRSHNNRLSIFISTTYCPAVNLEQMKTLVVETLPSSSDGTEGCIDAADLNELCSKCQRIDFQSAFALTSEQVGRSGKSITRTTKSFDASCALCSWIFSELVGDAAPVAGEVPTSEIKYHFRALDSLCILEAQRQPVRVASNPSIVIAIFRERSAKRKQINEAVGKSILVPLPQTSCLSDSGISKYTYEGRSVSAKHPNFALMASWVEDCSSHNGRCKRKPSKVNFQTRVIDCWTRKIVPLTENSEYLALSYVWRKGTQDSAMQQEMQDCDLPSSVPQTIGDALSVVRQLGRRYLWVDRHCIWTSEDKHTQTQNMHHIYQGALTTIVALHSEDAASGLPGVSFARCEQFRLQTNAGMVVSTFPHLSSQMWRSTWATRGWTYQEALLSRSCLFFTSDQVYFECKQNLESEAVRQSGNGRQLEVLCPRLLNCDEHIRFEMGARYTSSLDEHIKAYTSRSLSFDSGALNAFRGIVATGGAYTYWGIPFTLRRYGGRASRVTADNAEHAFAQNLAWHGRITPPKGENLRRRGGFPTWSWTSMIDQIDTRNKDFAFNVSGSDFQSSKFYVENGSELTKIQDIFERASKTPCLTIPEFGTAVVVEGRVAEVYLNPTDTRGIFDVYAHLPPVADRSPVETLLRRISGRAFIDGNDPDALSKIGHQTWQAVELFWNGDRSWSVWMLISVHGQSTRRIGLIESYFQRPGGHLPISDLIDLVSSRRMRDVPTRDMKVGIE